MKPAAGMVSSPWPSGPNDRDRRARRLHGVEIAVVSARKRRSVKPIHLFSRIRRSIPLKYKDSMSFTHCRASAAQQPRLRNPVLEYEIISRG
jgi:hypothetical protein